MDCLRSRPLRPARGFTLIEMMVSITVMAIVMIGVYGAMTANSRQFNTQANLSGTQGNLRYASMTIERALLHAGYGIDPNFALEPRPLDASGNEVGQRDNSGPDSSDELVVQFADPGFRRTISGVSAAGFTLDRPLATDDAFHPGQRLLALCESARDFAYVTVSSYDEASRAVSLNAGAAAPFNEQSKLDAACFSSGRAIVRRIERRHFFIAMFQEPDGLPPRPALMVSRGVDLDDNGTTGEMPTGWPGLVALGTSSNDAELVALDIEQLQIAYVMNRPSATLAAQLGLINGPDADHNFIFGDSGAADSPSADNPVWSGSGSAPDPKAPPRLGDPDCTSLLDGVSHCGYGGARRFTGHPGNVREVRFTLVGRSAQENPDVALNTVEGDEGRIENRPAGGVETHHLRMRLQSTIALRNVFLRKHFVPPEQNVDGG